ncbi:MAG: hypothetical protein AAB857_03335, partial [Patescibacteria group bacterium]
ITQPCHKPNSFLSFVFTSSDSFLVSSPNSPLTAYSGMLAILCNLMIEFFFNIFFADLWIFTSLGIFSGSLDVI